MDYERLCQTGDKLSFKTDSFKGVISQVLLGLTRAQEVRGSPVRTNVIRLRVLGSEVERTDVLRSGKGSLGPSRVDNGREE